ncbi:peptidase M64 [bacterium]|nr:MAG: peptidase M64 [bacterium]
MKNLKLYFVVIALCLFSIANAQVSFDDYFLSKSLRLDYIQGGNDKETEIYLEQLKMEPYWGGSKKNLIDKFNYGDYRLYVNDVKTNKLIYSHGYSSLFQEWQASDEAKTVKRSFYETVLIPYPKEMVKVRIDKRDKNGYYVKKLEYIINPKSYFINPEANTLYVTKKVLDSGDPSVKVDIVFLPEGYTSEEMTKFNNDVQRFMGYFFNCSPYRENKNNFNVWLVEAPSQESGTDIPGKGIYKKTIMNTSFYTFDVERYCMTQDVKTVRDLAGTVPYDQIIILVNSDKYGGGGVYNYYNIVTSDDAYSDYVICHEFGHGFADLADEYWTSDVAVSDYFNLKVEPWQPNITTLVNFESKWKNMVSTGIPIPTPGEEKYYDKVGAFEGGGYVEKGIYRPMFDCTMKSRKRDGFCPVCKKAIDDMIKFYSE